MTLFSITYRVERYSFLLLSVLYKVLYKEQSILCPYILINSMSNTCFNYKWIENELPDVLYFLSVKYKISFLFGL